jgi:hypothetical protein
VRALLRPLVVRALRREPDEIERRAVPFRIDSERGRALVRDLGRAFLGGFNAMLAESTPGAAAARGRGVPPHFRPFYFEGLAMGYLPRGWYDRACTAARFESTLLGLDPAFLFLYYVGLGFWYAFRHPGRPGRLCRLAPHVDPLYLPLCFDGFGFKTAFFDAPGKPPADVLDRCPEACRPFLCQGLGRASFFVFLDDEPGYRAYRDALPADHRRDADQGRALACAFTGLDRPDALVAHIDEAAGEDERKARLAGVTWALTARRRNDPAYFESCLGAATPADAVFLRRLPELCEAALRESADYGEWQRRTRDALARIR